MQRPMYNRDRRYITICRTETIDELEVGKDRQTTLIIYDDVCYYCGTEQNITHAYKHNQDRHMKTKDNNPH
jgi:hypothetical protein